MKPRTLRMTMAFGILTALAACSWFGGGNSNSQPAAARAPPTTSTAVNPIATSRAAAPVSPALIRQVQTRLRSSNNYSGPIDGVWGPMTQNGLRQWQQEHRLAATGVIDHATLQSMNIPPPAAGAINPADGANP